MSTASLKSLVASLLLLLGPASLAAPRGSPVCEPVGEEAKARRGAEATAAEADTVTAPAGDGAGEAGAKGKGQSRAAPRPFPPEVQRALDAIVRAEMSQGPVAALSVGVTRGDQRWVCAYGQRDVARRLPATPRTTYRMASITKSFTAVAVLQLAEQGKLDLDADISTLVPAYPHKQWPVTVRDLLGHLSGVPTYDGLASSNNVKPMTTAEAIAVFAEKPLAFEPRTRYLYTTWGFNLLGAAVEAASGQSYRDYLREHVFEPAGMEHADLDIIATRDEHQAAGYRVADGTLKPSRFLDVTSRFGGGGTRATVGDMLAFGRAVVDHSLVSRETMGRMQASMATSDGRLTDYGMGFATYPLRGHYLVAHAGGQPETTTLLVMFPAEDTVIALATNVEGEAKRMRRLSIRVMEQMLEDGLTRRDAHLADGVDSVVYEGLGRIASYGLAYHQWATRGPGSMPADEDLPGAFARVSELLDRKLIAKDSRAALERIRGAHDPRLGSVFIRVGAHMARKLEEAHGPERLRAYPAEGALAFFADYLAACDARGLPDTERFGEPLRSDLLRFVSSWKRAEVPALRRMRLDEIQKPETHWPALKEAAAAAPELRPDYSDELLRIAEGHALKKQTAARLRWLERAVELQPRSVDARVALANALLAAKRDAEVLPHLREALATPHGALALTPAGLMKRANEAESPRVALGLLRAGTALHPESPELWEALAKREGSQGNKTQAKAALRKARRAREVGAAPASSASRSAGERGVPDDHGLVRPR
ncbi:beta-lactamase family protein [Pyxidicoccus fallax]|uniref:Beta-lactamase family protein n=1 Tax=Pyxidicoccus fallax TaxID=394095 RepID=A0A848LZL5_9BACT|nr:serine hydrolase domain-containing protein [Pyxidicoccus fallax]NMO23040.1 beta-lactamase family protein [Pyxidicoccus fallax]NPC85275.1 beta-lactamase family protein [Pyxidicoccus fallax]